jgi:hypothetical protein
MSSKASSVDSFSGNDGLDSKIMGPKNVTDLVMEHGVLVDGEDMISCRYCDDYLSRGVYAFLRHLAGTGTENDVEVCEGVGDEVREEMLGIFSDLQESHEEGCVGVGEKRKGNEVAVGSSRDDLKRRRVGSQAIAVNNMVKKTLRGEASRAVARFFYNNDIPLDAVKSDEFITMCELVSRHGLGFVPPSFDDLKGKYLTEEVKLTREALEEHRAIWKIKGCTIMVDGWTDPKKRNILNILVNNPRRTFFLKSVDASNMLESPNKLFKMMDEIVEEVGEENVVQIVTDNTTYYKVAGEMLMAKRTRLYWTPCATHTIEMILEDYEKIPIHEETITKAKRVLAFIHSRASLIPRLQHFTKGIDLVKQGVPCCAASYLTLGCIHENEGALRRMFTSKEWKSSQLAKTRNGKYVEDVVLDTRFWENVMICFKSAHPLVKVLCLVSSIEEPATGSIYEALEQAKQEIRMSLSKGVTER